jgi:hypothetical protein
MDMISNDEPPALVCRIEKSRMGNIVQVGGRIVARETVAGDFRLTVRSFGPGGSSSVQQSGQFHVTGGREISVGKATVSFGKGAKLAADLEVRVGEQVMHCNNGTLGGQDEGAPPADSDTTDL